MAEQVRTSRTHLVYKPVEDGLVPARNFAFYPYELTQFLPVEKDGEVPVTELSAALSNIPSRVAENHYKAPDGVALTMLERLTSLIDDEKLKVSRPTDCR